MSDELDDLTDDDPDRFFAEADDFVVLSVAESRRIVREKSECGANAAGGGGFQPGNTCADDEDGGGFAKDDLDQDGEPDNPVDDPDRDSAEGQGDLFDKNDGKGPPSIRDLPIEKQWQETLPLIDELVAEAEGEEIEGIGPTSFYDLDEDAQTEAQQAWENDNFDEYHSSHESEIRDEIQSQLESDVRGDPEYTVQVLESMAEDYGFEADEESLRQAADSEGAVEPSWLKWNDIDPDDPTGDVQAAAKWEEIKADFEERYEQWIESSVEDQVDDAVSSAMEDASESILEAMSTDWHEGTISDETKLSYADTSSVPTTVEIPDNFEPFEDEGDAEDYQKTRSVVRYIQDTRARAILEERGIDPGKVDQLHSETWREWKASSTSAYGEALQLAAADELGSVGKPEYETRRADIIARVGGDDQFEALKGYVRATWESSQYALEKSERQEITVWRGLMLPGAAVDETTRGNIGPDGKYAKLPDLKILRNAAQSTTSDPSVANSWGGVGQRPENAKRVVLRIKADARSVLSLPVHGQNLKHENEVILTGHGWTKWDAWLDRAPSVDIDSPEDQELHGKAA